MILYSCFLSIFDDATGVGFPEIDHLGLGTETENWPSQYHAHQVSLGWDPEFLDLASQSWSDKDKAIKGKISMSDYDVLEFEA